MYSDMLRSDHPEHGLIGQTRRCDVYGRGDAAPSQQSERMYPCGDLPGLYNHGPYRSEKGLYLVVRVTGHIGRGRHESDHYVEEPHARAGDF